VSPAGAPDHDSWGEVSVAPSTPLKAEYRGSARGAPVLLHRRGSCRVSTWEDPLMSCPRCMSVSVTKDGTTPLGGQRFRCKPMWSALDARVQRSRVAPSQTTSSPWPCAGTCATASVTSKSVNGWPSAASWSIRAPFCRWVQHFLPLFGEVARRYREPVGPDWRVDETYARIGGHWHYL